MPLWANKELVTAMFALAVPVRKVLIQLPVFSLMVELLTTKLNAPEDVSTETPCVPKLAITTSSSTTLLAAKILTPLMPFPAPLIEIPRILTTAVKLLTIMPFVKEARIEPCVSSQSIVIDLVIVTAP